MNKKKKPYGIGKSKSLLGKNKEPFSKYISRIARGKTENRKKHSLRNL